MPDPADGPVTLRPWRAEDAVVLAAAWHDPAVIAGSTPPEDRSLAAAIRWIEGVGVREQRLLAVDRVVDVAGHCVGEVGLSDIDQRRGAALIGWWVAADHRGNGYARQAVEAMVEVAADFGVHTLVAQIGIDNAASIRIAEQTGFELLRSGSVQQPHVYARR